MHLEFLHLFFLIHINKLSVTWFIQTCASVYTRDQQHVKFEMLSGTSSSKKNAQSQEYRASAKTLAHETVISSMTMAQDVKFLVKITISHLLIFWFWKKNESQSYGEVNLL